MASDPAIDSTRQVLRAALAEGVFPAAVAEVGASEAPLWREAVGSLQSGLTATLETRFDLASLTKPIVTTSLALDLITRGALSLKQPVATVIADWRGADRQDVTIRDLLEHASGLPARLLDAPPEGRRAFEHEIAVAALEYAPRSRSLYSDLDFILLGFIIEDRGRGRLDEQFTSLLTRLNREHPASADVSALTYGVPREHHAATAATTPMPQDWRRGRLLVGEVHDNYAATLGGIAGHAGLFGTTAAVGAFARLALRGARGDAAAPSPFDPESMRQATSKSRVPGSSRALGWDTMLPTSSCGVELSPASFGHVGFTGTSLWIDPERDRYYVLLSNRVAGSAPSEVMQVVRRRFHDAASAI